MESIGPYQIVRRLAVGGMAEVYLAKKTGIAGFELPVALKLIHPNLADNCDFIAMLVDEAKIAATLSHPNIAQTLDLGCASGRYYIAMEYIEGIDVFNLLRAAKCASFELPIDACAFVARELASALEHAHTMRDCDDRLLEIIHRDVSADNVLIAYSGAVKLVDFGIARATSRAQQTAAGVIKGKYGYMSPEQISGGPVDATTDIYSTGIVLYEMLTGRTLYDTSDLHQLAARIRAGNFAPPSRFRADIPPELERIVLRALQRDRKDRYQSAGEMANELQQFLQSYSPFFVTTTLGSLVAVLMDRVGAPIAPPAKPRSKITMRRAHSRHVIKRQPRESDLDIQTLDESAMETIEDPSKQIRIYTPAD